MICILYYYIHLYTYEPPSELRTIRFIRNGPLTLQGCERHAKPWGPHPKRCPRKSCPKPCKILGDARKSRQHVVFERCPERCPNDARPDGSRTCQEHLAQASCRAKACRAHLQSASPAKSLALPASAGPALPFMLPRTPRCPCAPAKHLTLPVHSVTLGPHVKSPDSSQGPYGY